MISEVVVMVGKIFISIVTAAVSYVMMNRYLASQLHSPLGPVLFVMIMAYFAASMFMNVFSVVVSTVLHCFLADEEMFGHNGAYHSPKSLKRWIDKHGAISSKVPRVGSSPKQ